MMVDKVLPIVEIRTMGDVVTLVIVACPEV